MAATEKKLCKVCWDPRPAGYSSTCGRSECQQAEYYLNAAEASRKGSAQKSYFEREAEVLVARANAAREASGSAWNRLVARWICPVCDASGVKSTLKPTGEDTLFCTGCLGEFKSV